MRTPRVSVLMPVYNGSGFLREAIDSVLTQTFVDFEMLILDDASTDETPRIVRDYHDPRLSHLRNSENLKIARTLNRGLDLAKGEYIARMDADDISLPTRLEKQVALLDSRPEIGVCGTWAQEFGEASGLIRHSHDPAINRARLLFDSVLAHPTVMLRRTAVSEPPVRYPPLPDFEDYLLWQRLSDRTQITNLQEPLLRYRVRAESAYFGAARGRQKSSYQEIDKERLPCLGLTPSQRDLECHYRLRRPDGPDEPAVEQWLWTLRKANCESRYADPTAFDTALRERWAYYCFGCALPRGRKLARYAGSDLSRIGAATARMKIRTLMKFLLKG